MSETIEQVLNFDDADLSSNRLGQLTQKQKNVLILIKSQKEKLLKDGN